MDLISFLFGSILIFSLSRTQNILLDDEYELGGVQAHGGLRPP
jgi:hypothetical protein